MMLWISDETDLMELEECLKQSSDFPFAGLTFQKPWKFSTADSVEFFKNYGARFTRIRLGTRWNVSLLDLIPFIHDLPRLSILEAGWPCRRSHKFLDSAAGQKDGRILNLPSLRTFRISSEWSEGALREVLTATSPSLRIECLKSSYEILEALKDAGKLQAVSVLNVHEDLHRKDALREDKLFSTEWAALAKLDFRTGGCISPKGLMKLLIASQHTLKELLLFGICPSHFSSECPVLDNLTTLSLRIFDGSYEYVFKGRHGHKFPALRELKLVTADIDYDPTSAPNLSDGLFIVPSLKTIELYGYLDKAGIEDLARSFPNVTEIRTNDHVDVGEWSWKKNPVDIGSLGAFKFLEKLEIWHCTVEPSTQNYINMDRFLTGIPITICENLRKHQQLNLMDSPFNELLRDSPSILQLKNLKELTVFVNPGHPLEELPEEPPFISMVSVWYALQMMPNLRAKFLYDYSWLSRHLGEERWDKAVKAMKAAFKNVQPYVDLEPFYH